MATTTGIKFYAGSYGKDTAVTKATNGAIVFDKTTHSLFVDGVQFGGNIADATFSNNVLTITKADGTSQIQLDFSSLATTSSVMAVFNQIGTEIDAIETGAGLGTNGAYTADSTTNYLTQATSLTDADKKLDAQIKSLSDTVGGLTTGVSDVQINSTSIESNGVADIAVDGTYNASTNKIATQSTVTNAINALDRPLTSIVSTNTLQTGELRLTLNQIQQVDGLVTAVADETVDFAKVSTTGAAEDVSITDSGNLIIATTVEGALAEIAGEIDGMDLAATSLMTQTDDTTNGNSTFTISGIQEADGVVSLASGNNVSFKTDGVYNASSNLIATQSTVTTAIQNALDSEVTFQGVTSTLPSTPTNGDMYKASAAISIPQASAGQGEAVTTKAGDTIIYKNVTGAQNNGWYVIPSGDESMSDTWRAIKVNNTEVLGSGISTGDVNFVNGTLTTVSESNGAISINHVTPTAANDNLQALKIQLDSYGHIVGTSALTIGDLGGVSGINHGTDGNYITINITDDASDDEYTISGELTFAELSNTYGQYSGNQYVSAARHGLLTDADVNIMKNYIDYQVENLDSIADADTASGTGYATITTDTPTADFKVLNSVTEVDGVITAGTAYNIKKVAATGAAEDITVTSANYGGSTATTNLQTALNNLASATCSVTNNAAAIPVNGSVVTLATVDGTSITASATFYWEEYA